MAEELKVGGELDAWCTSCKLMKWHTIVALVGNKPAKVECQGCHKQHQFRAAPPGSSTGGGAGGGEKKPRASKAAVAAAAATVDFDALVGGRAGEARPYSPDTRYALGDLVRHPSFEVGVVTAAPAGQKIEVTFRAGKKILLHDRGAATPSKLGPAPRRDDSVQPSGTSDSPRGQK